MTDDKRCDQCKVDDVPPSICKRETEREQLEHRVTAVLEVVNIVGDTIRDLHSVPSGHLYARLAGHMDLEIYNNIIDMLVQAKQVRRDRSHLLTWIGPAK